MSLIAVGRTGNSLFENRKRLIVCAHSSLNQVNDSAIRRYANRNIGPARKPIKKV
jgi:hypothetical protein